MPVKIKFDEAGHAVIKDGHVVVIHEDGKELPFDIDHTLGTITRLNGEAMGHRREKEEALGKLKLFDGIDDPEVARSAMDKVKSLSAGELKTAEQVAEIQREAQKTADEQVRAAAETGARRLREMTGERDGLKNELFNERIGGAFARSSFIKDKTVVPVDMLQSMFANRFKYEDGKLVGHDASGNKLFSRTKAGEIADFDEALETIVDSYAHRDSVLKGTGNAGGGARQHGGGGGGGNTMTRAEFQKLGPTEQMEAAKTKTIVDA